MGNMKFNNIEYTEIEDISDRRVIESIELLGSEIFGYFNLNNFCNRLQENIPFKIIIALENKELVGFKVGYRINNDIFFSWLGGVKQSYRRKGIANHLMILQHEWCQNNGFEIVETHTTQERQEMCLLNLKHNFKQTGFFLDKNKIKKIILHKTLQVLIIFNIFQ